MFWVLIPILFSYAILKESDDGLNLTISGDGSVNSTAVHQLSYDKFLYIELKDGINRIESSSFSKCSSVLQIKFPSKLEYIGSNALEQCTNLLSLELPEGLVSIPSDLLSYCYAIQNISIPSTVETISPTFIWICPKMNKFIVSIYNKNYSIVQNGEILTDYSKTTAISCKESGTLIIPKDIEVIGNSFAYYKKLSTITFESGSNVKIFSSKILDACDATSIEIPSSLERVEDLCFYRSNVIHLTFPSTLTYLSPTAFSKASNLQSVTIPDNCTAIKKIGGIIYDPEETQIIFIPLSITNLSISKNLLSVDITLVRGTQSLEGVYVDPDNEALSSYDDALYTKYKDTFNANPYNKKIIHVHKNCTTIGHGAFMGTLIEEVYFDGNITKINGEGFSGCSNLEIMTFPISVSSIGNWVFTSCEKWKASVVFGPDFYSSSESSFYYAGITSVDLSQSKLTTISSEMFFGCSSLSVLKLPVNCVNINDRCFMNCPILKLEIGNKVTSIGDEAFSGCTKLEEVVFTSKSVLLTVGMNSFAQTKITKILFPSSISTINSKSFKDCNSLTNITFEKENKLSTIAADAFDGCNMTEVILPSTISSINPTSFSICKSLKNIIIGDGQTPGTVYRSIDGAVFSSDGLTLIICPSGRENFEVESFVRWIGQKAFMNCKNLNLLVFGEGSQIESLNSSVFEGCSALARVIFADDNPVYKRMSGRKQRNQGAILKEIGSSVFSGCTALEEFRFPAGVRTIKSSAFEGCLLLKTALPAGLEKIEASGFKGCSSLTRVDLGPNVKFVGAECFFGCDNLETVTYCGTTSLDIKAFEGNIKLNREYRSVEAGNARTSHSIRCFVLPLYPSESLCGLPVLKTLDSGCNIPTSVFTDGGILNTGAIEAVRIAELILCDCEA